MDGIRYLLFTDKSIQLLGKNQIIHWQEKKKMKDQTDKTSKIQNQIKRMS